MSPGPLPPYPLPRDAEPLRCDVGRDGGAATVRVSGALDMATVPTLEAELSALGKVGVRHIILDLSGLDFMDSTGLRCILELDAAARQDGFSLSLVAGPRAVQRVFEITGTAAHLSFIAR